MPETLPPPVVPQAELITGVPEFPVNATPNHPETSFGLETVMNPERKLNFLERIKLGPEELAICGVIDLNPSKNSEQKSKKDEKTERILILDVGFKKAEDGRYGPYDIDGSGVMRTFDKPYVLVNMQPQVSSEQQNTAEARPEAKFLQVDDFQELTLGRSTEEGRLLGLDTNDHISRNHVTIRFGAQGGIEVRDLNSSNGTTVHAPGELVQSSDANYGYTVSVSDYVHSAGKGNHYVPKNEKPGRGYGEFAGRPIVARDTEINGGVYPVGSSQGEAIVIDDERYPDELNQVYEAVINRIQAPDTKKLSVRGLRRALTGAETNVQQDSTVQKLESVFDTVFETLKYDLAATNALARDSQKIALNYYITEGVGVCRTQAVLAAYNIERMIKNGLLEGKVSIDRSSIRDADGNGSGHAWARFTDKLGNVFIIDPAQRYVGPIDQSPDRNWDYRRTEDIIKQLAAV
jgi:FHA domain